MVYIVTLKYTLNKYIHAATTESYLRYLVDLSTGELLCQNKVCMPCSKRRVLVIRFETLETMNKTLVNLPTFCKIYSIHFVCDKVRDGS